MSKERKLVEDFKQAESEILRATDKRIDSAVSLFTECTGIGIGMEVEETFGGNVTCFIVKEIQPMKMGVDSDVYLWRHSSGIKIERILGISTKGSGRKRLQEIVGTLRIPGDTRCYRVSKKV